MKFLESNFMGLTNATEVNVDLIDKYGLEGLHIDAHSRGGLTLANAVQATIDQGGVSGSAAGLTANFYGSAANVQAADDNIAYLQNRDSMTTDQKNAAVSQYSVHSDDLVGTWIGRNPATGGTVPTDSSSLLEMLRGITGQFESPHNCYGSATPGCANQWKDLPNEQSTLVPIQTYK